MLESEAPLAGKATARVGSAKADVLPFRADLLRQALMKTKLLALRHAPVEDEPKKKRKFRPPPPTIPTPIKVIIRVHCAVSRAPLLPPTTWSELFRDP
jgi:hypothetical protein